MTTNPAPALTMPVPALMYTAPSDAEMIAALAAMPVAQSTLDARAERTRAAAARPSYYWGNRTGGTLFN